tara:strand:- start:216 stop:797 length:582 start_codon:yes stop_codon:yes gene_type:complete
MEKVTKVNQPDIDPVRKRLYCTYAGQQVLRVKGEENLSYPEHYIMAELLGCKHWLELKPLHKITEEDAIEVAKVVLNEQLMMDGILQTIHGKDQSDLKATVVWDLYDPKKKIKNKKNIGNKVYDYWNVEVRFHGVPWVLVMYEDEMVFYNDDEVEPCKSLCGFDMLRGLGYAVEFADIPVEEQIKKKWLKFQK